MFVDPPTTTRGANEAFAKDLLGARGQTFA
jgi:hypothetical protein